MITSFIELKVLTIKFVSQNTLWEISFVKVLNLANPSLTLNIQYIGINTFPCSWWSWVAHTARAKTDSYITYHVSFWQEVHPHITHHPQRLICHGHDLSSSSSSRVNVSSTVSELSESTSCLVSRQQSFVLLIASEATHQYNHGMFLHTGTMLKRLQDYKFYRVKSFDH